MKTLLISFCVLSLALNVGATEKKKKSKTVVEKAEPVHRETHVTHSTVRTTIATKVQKTPSRGLDAHPHSIQSNTTTTVPLPDLPNQRAAITNGDVPHQQTVPLTKDQADEAYAQSQGFRNAEQYRKWKETGQIEGSTHILSSKPYKYQPITIGSKPPQGVSGIAFANNSHIVGSQSWAGDKYKVYRDYSAARHDKPWWKTHYPRIIFVFGGWYYWSNSYWYPAWGYEPTSVYAYDGPIFAYHEATPDQVVANIQAALKALGYYYGPVDGWLDSSTSAAISNYQRDRGLYPTGTADEITLGSLGLA